MNRPPSKRKSKTKKPNGLNLVPILDAVFIFIFFLLLSTNFLKIFEISSQVPIVSYSAPKKSRKKPLALTLKIGAAGFTLLTGVPSRLHKTIKKNDKNSYDFTALHDYLITLKKKYIRERTIILEPLVDIDYDIIIKIMDAVRALRATDDTIFEKNKNGINEKVKYLFDNILFGNILS